MGTISIRNLPTDLFSVIYAGVFNVLPRRESPFVYQGRNPTPSAVFSNSLLARSVDCPIGQGNYKLMQGFICSLNSRTTLRAMNEAPLPSLHFTSEVSLIFLAFVLQIATMMQIACNEATHGEWNKAATENI
jgi:hypothetical protein